MPTFTLLLIFIIAFVLVILIAYALVIYGLRDIFFTGQDVGVRLATYATVPEENEPVSTSRRRRVGLVRFRLQLNNMLSGLASQKLNLQLISANWPITETEYVLIRICSVIVAFGLGWVITRTSSPGAEGQAVGLASVISREIVAGVGLAVITFFVPDLILKRAISQRRVNFGKQLVDLLVLMTGAVRAGYSLPQAIEVVSKEMKAPASDEFRRVRHEIGLGLSLTQALANLVARMENDDLYLVVTAININSQVGGNIVTMLEAVSSTIRERVRLFSEVRVLTAQQRFGSYVLTFLPVAMAAAMFFLNPDYMMKLFDPQILCIPIGAAIMVVLGNIAVRRLGKIDV